MYLLFKRNKRDFHRFTCSEALSGSGTEELKQKDGVSCVVGDGAETANSLVALLASAWAANIMTTTRRTDGEGAPRPTQRGMARELYRPIEEKRVVLVLPTVADSHFGFHIAILSLYSSVVYARRTH